MKPIRIGTRGSRLALWQAGAVRDALVAHGHAPDAIEIMPIRTSGDVIRDGITLRVQIYRIRGSNEGWSLEVVDHEWGRPSGRIFSPRIRMPIASSCERWTPRDRARSWKN